MLIFMLPEGSLLCSQKIHYCVHKRFITVFTKDSLLCSQKIHYYVHKRFITMFTKDSLLCSQTVLYCVHKRFITAFTKGSSLRSQKIHHWFTKGSTKASLLLSQRFITVLKNVSYWIQICISHRNFSHQFYLFFT